MEKLTTAARRARIAALKEELAELYAQESAESGAEAQAVIEECRTLKRAHKPIDAVKLYRNKMGCGLREAHDFVRTL
jgi:ribosomal protein L7/L12